MTLFLRIVMVLFGCFELINNIKYLKTENGIKKAYNQHFEIPATVSMEIMRKKVITMLAIGILFLTAFIFTFVFQDQMNWIISATFMIYLVYVWGETLYYRTHTKAYALALLITGLTVLSIFAV